jgi:hypothetical protein
MGVEMKVIIAGERDYPLTYLDLIKAIKASGFDITEVVSGHSGNVDLGGEAWAENHKIPVKIFRPDWIQGRKAGPIRNTKMADYANALILVWTGKGRGSADILTKCKMRNLPIFEVRT